MPNDAINLLTLPDDALALIARSLVADKKLRSLANLSQANKQMNALMPAALTNGTLEVYQHLAEHFPKLPLPQNEDELKKALMMILCQMDPFIEINNPDDLQALCDQFSYERKWQAVPDLRFSEIAIENEKQWREGLQCWQDVPVIPFKETLIALRNKSSWEQLKKTLTQVRGIITALRLLVSGHYGADLLNCYSEAERENLYWGVLKEIGYWSEFDKLRLAVLFKQPLKLHKLHRAWEEALKSKSGPLLKDIVCADNRAAFEKYFTEKTLPEIKGKSADQQEEILWKHINYLIRNGAGQCLNYLRDYTEKNHSGLDTRCKDMFSNINYFFELIKEGYIRAIKFFFSHIQNMDLNHRELLLCVAVKQKDINICKILLNGLSSGDKLTQLTSEKGLYIFSFALLTDDIPTRIEMIQLLLKGLDSSQQSNLLCRVDLDLLLVPEYQGREETIKFLLSGLSSEDKFTLSKYIFSHALRIDNVPTRIEAIQFLLKGLDSSQQSNLLCQVDLSLSLGSACYQGKEETLKVLLGGLSSDDKLTLLTSEKGRDIFYGVLIIDNISSRIEMIQLLLNGLSSSQQSNLLCRVDLSLLLNSKYYQGREETAKAIFFSGLIPVHQIPVLQSFIPIYYLDLQKAMEPLKPILARMDSKEKFDLWSTWIDKFNHRPLHYAVSFRKVEVVKAILEGLTLEHRYELLMQRDGEGKGLTPLSWALLLKEKNIVEIMVCDELTSEQQQYGLLLRLLEDINYSEPLSTNKRMRQIISKLWRGLNPEQQRQLLTPSYSGFPMLLYFVACKEIKAVDTSDNIFSLEEIKAIRSKPDCKKRRLFIELLHYSAENDGYDDVKEFLLNELPLIIAQEESFPFPGEKKQLRKIIPVLLGQSDERYSVLACKLMIGHAQRAYFMWYEEEQHKSGALAQYRPQGYTARALLENLIQATACDRYRLFKTHAVDGQKRAVTFLEEILSVSSLSEIQLVSKKLMQGKLTYNEQAISGSICQHKYSFLTFLKETVAAYVPEASRNKILACFKLADEANEVMAPRPASYSCH
ncbi:MAG: hypothetical protein K0S08_1493 [Gammaproteobacteria bacterium]|nr:hypothetical protein [Gammaproteobacteria bacterium]